MAKPRKHHYVPQFLLRNFINNKKVFVFDKKTRNKFSANTADILAQRDYYSVELRESGLYITFEEKYSEIESELAPAVKRICSKENLNEVHEEDIVKCAMLAAVQFTRSKNFRRSYAEISDHFRDITSIDDDNPLEKYMDSDSFRKMYEINSSLEIARDLFPYLLYKQVFLLLDTKGRFLTSDSPVVLHNDKDYRPYGNLGFGVPGIQVYMPLTPSITVCFLCKTIVSEFQTSIYEYERQIQEHERFEFKSGIAFKEKTILDRTERRQKLGEMKLYISRITIDKKLHVTNENVIFLNHLQVASSERYLVSRGSDFGLVDNILRRDSSLRDGRSMFTMP